VGVVDRFALASGERQVAPALDGIRRDHIVRYQFVIDRIRTGLSEAPRFGADVFCGVGYGTRMLADALDCPVLGIDGSAEAVEFGNQHYASPRTILSHKLFPFALPQAAFDFVCCIESLEHVGSHEQFMNVLAASLRPDGILVVTTPNECILSLKRNRNPFHTRHFAPEELVRMMTAMAFELMEQASQDVYVMRDGQVVDTLPEAKFDIRCDTDGQFSLGLFRKRIGGGGGN
jgi:2-polyprenyl-3-methyl-5-hydroxy-6-metoxy-1,4-benzoquinol methylase